LTRGEGIDTIPLPEETRPQPADANPLLGVRVVKGYEIVLAPTAMGDTLTIAFIKDGGALIELMQMKA